MQLLKITTVPIKYKEQENIPVDSGNSQAFSLDMAEKTSDNVRIPVSGTNKSENSTEMYKNSVTGVQTNAVSQQNGVQRKADSMVHESASENEENTYNVNYRYGAKNVQTQPKQNVSEFMRNNIQAASSIDSALDNMESVVPDKSWEPEVKAHHDKILKAEPRKVVEEFAHVEIEYLGGFNYVPKSSAPDYEEPEE